jgi:hypothetical protein
MDLDAFANLIKRGGWQAADEYDGSLQWERTDPQTTLGLTLWMREDGTVTVSASDPQMFRFRSYDTFAQAARALRRRGLLEG